MTKKQFDFGHYCFTHEFVFDLPWHLVNPFDWLFMINAGNMGAVVYLHFRFLGVRSLWKFFDFGDKNNG